MEIVKSISILLTIAGGLVFITNVITQIIKELSFIKEVPTNLLVLCISELLTVSVMVIYTQINDITILWYFIVAAIIGGFMVAYIAMYGWQKFYDLWDKSKNKEGGADNDK